jgi:predicted TIM-barrel fold metal-dependent hydrolase
LRLIVSGLFDRFPALQLIIGHRGVGLPYALARSSEILSDEQADGRERGERSATVTG